MIICQFYVFQLQNIFSHVSGLGDFTELELVDQFSCSSTVHLRQLEAFSTKLCLYEMKKQHKDLLPKSGNHQRLKDLLPKSVHRQHLNHQKMLNRIWGYCFICYFLTGTQSGKSNRSWKCITCKEATYCRPAHVFFMVFALNHCKGL